MSRRILALHTSTHDMKLSSSAAHEVGSPVVIDRRTVLACRRY